MGMLDDPQPCPICGRSRRIGHVADLSKPCQYCARWIAVFDHPLGPWVDEAICSQTDPEAFFPESSLAFALDAKEVCARCPVRIECLTHALEANEQHGIWGGLTPKERKQLMKKGGRAA